ncbi:MAG: hypothetical protein Q9200_000599 [Gallowayella weberi]
MASSLPPGLLDMIPAGLPPTGVQPNFIHPVTLGKEIIAVSVVSSVLAVALLCTRLYSTLRITRSAWYDDITSVLATVFALAYIALIINTRDYSRHSWDLPISALTSSFFKIILAQAIIGASSILLSKMSILLLLYRLFAPNKRFRYFVYIGLLWAILTFCTSLVVALALCVPRPREAFISLQCVCGKCPLSCFQGEAPGELRYVVQYVQGANSEVSDLFHLNIVETNAAIMVACMPACASFRRFFSAQGEFLSDLKSRLLSVRISLARGGKGSSNSKDSSNAMIMAEAGESQVKSGTSTNQAGRNWKLENAYSREKHSLPSQITANKEQSPTLASVRLNTTDWALASGDLEKREKAGSSQEGEESLPSSLDKMV